MGAINNVVSLLNESIDVSIAYVKEHGVALILLVLLWRFLMGSFRDRYPNGWSSTGYSLTSSSAAATSETTKSSNRQEEMRLVRERQQKIADERAKQAAIQRKEKEAKEKERRNHAALPNYPGDRLGDGTGPTNNPTTSRSSSSHLRTNDYNPMQPWNTSTSGYRPTRRTPPGGGS